MKDYRAYKTLKWTSRETLREELPIGCTVLTPRDQLAKVENYYLRDSDHNRVHLRYLGGKNKYAAVILKPNLLRKIESKEELETWKAKEYAND